MANSHGEFNGSDYAHFCSLVQAGFGIRLADYQADQMCRRLSRAAFLAGYHSFASYFRAIEREPALRQEFLQTITINVTELLRNPHLFDYLSVEILPELIEGQRFPSLSIWSAGCSNGAEAYTLSMLVREMIPSPRVSIVGTDLDASILDRARQPSYTDRDMKGVSWERRQRHFEQIEPDVFVPKPGLRSGVTFLQHDLLGDEYPEGVYDLVLCRNVMIYFTDSARVRVYRNIRRALKPGGVLFLGGAEPMRDPGLCGLVQIRPFFYRNPEASALAA